MFNFSILYDCLLITESDKTAEAADSTEKTNGHVSDEKGEELQPGPSSSTGNDEDEKTENLNENSNENSNDAEENEDDGGNLEVAWEVLQNAALIFQRQEEKGLSNLLEVYNEMAGISIENGNFALALDDFGRALNTFDCVEDSQKNYRIAAEIHYKIGLCQSMEKAYDESVKSFQKAHDILSDVIKEEKSKEQQTEDVLANIKDMEETQQEIMNKITEIGEVKAEEIEQVKKELTKLYGMNGSADGAGCSSSSTSSTIPTTAAANSSVKSPTESDKPKPTDISHLIKRKKPDTSDAVECSPAKKKAVEAETSPGEKKVMAVPVENEEKTEKVVEEPPSVQVAVDN